ncbi:uncharacterized protein LOC123525175 [Mercenaria mercenaria]|uniref:uncharacterized protein LOC123525175 n=1 Tax=Mercenaria mercenaria TaxID=6596 RepID=UPI00234EA0B0|nr:uncharacterized protein LOC123525175 [Mercenaria mercenaria]
MENKNMRDHQQEKRDDVSGQIDNQVSNIGSRSEGYFDTQNERQENDNTVKMERQPPPQVDKERQQEGTGTVSGIPVNEKESRNTGITSDRDVEFKADDPETDGIKDDNASGSKEERDKNNLGGNDYSHAVEVDNVRISMPGNLNIIDETQDRDVYENRTQSMIPKHDASQNVGTSDNKPEDDKSQDQFDREPRNSEGRENRENAYLSPAQNENQNENNAVDMNKQEALAKIRRGQTYDEEEDSETVTENWIDNEAYDRAREKYVYFWKSQSIYSQWHKSWFYVDDEKFNCAEQFMMFKKAVLFGDDEIAGEILRCKDPKKIKALGREVRGFDPHKWQQNCLYIVRKGNKAKFTQNEGFLADILITYPKVLVEASPFDSIWGIGLDEDSPDAWDENTWRGTNYLGYVLTEVRDDIMVERGMIDEEDRERYIEKMMVAADLPIDASETDRHAQSRESIENQETKEETYFLFSGGIYSQFYETYFKIDGVEFSCAEQYMMYKKAVLFEDYEISKEILKRTIPKEIKHLGRQVRGFNDETWHQHCLHFVKEGNMAKFSQNEKLKKAIVTTYPKVFVEANPYDKIWGIGLKIQDKRARNKLMWHGKNFLGYVLTEVRDELMCQWGLLKKEKKLTYIDKLKEDWGTSVDDGSRGVNVSSRQTDHNYDHSSKNKERNKTVTDDKQSQNARGNKGKNGAKEKTSHNNYHQKHGHATHDNHDKTPSNYHNAPVHKHKTHSDKAGEKKENRSNGNTSSLSDDVPNVESKDWEHVVSKKKRNEKEMNIPETDERKQRSAMPKERDNKHTKKSDQSGHAVKTDRKTEKQSVIIEDFDINEMIGRLAEKDHVEASPSPPAKDTGKGKRGKHHEAHSEEVQKAETDKTESNPDHVKSRRKRKNLKKQK